MPAMKLKVRPVTTSQVNHSASAGRTERRPIMNATPPSTSAAGSSQAT